MSNARWPQLRNRGHAVASGWLIAFVYGCPSAPVGPDTGTRADVMPADAIVAGPDAITDSQSHCRVTVAHAEDIGPLAMPAVVLGRDGGHSVRIAGRLLWTFGDTFLSARASDGENVRSATAAWGGIENPLAIVEPLDARGAPLQLIPYTEAEAADNVTDALNGWALWAGGAIDDESGEARIRLVRVRLE